MDIVQETTKFIGTILYWLPSEAQGHFYTGKIPNTRVLRKEKIGLLGIDARIANAQLLSAGHVILMDNSRLPKMASFLRVDNRRK